jgi:hypothetical protein
MLPGPYAACSPQFRFGLSWGLIRPPFSFGHHQELREKLMSREGDGRDCLQGGGPPAARLKHPKEATRELRTLSSRLTERWTLKLSSAGRRMPLELQEHHAASLHTWRFRFARVLGRCGAVSPSGTNRCARSWWAENGMGGIACRHAAH